MVFRFAPEERLTASVVMVLILPAPAKRVGIYKAMLTEKPIAKTNKMGSIKV